MEEAVTNNGSDVNAHMDRFIDNLRARKYSGKSISTYIGAMKAFTAFLQVRGKSDVLDVTAEDLSAYRLSMIEHGLRQNSVYLYMRVVKLLFKYLYNHECVFVNPAENMDTIGVDKRMQPIPTEAEVRLLLAAPDTGTAAGVRDRAMLETFYSTAVRIGEMVGMDLGCVRLDEATMRIMGKGGRERILPIGGTALEWIRKYLEVREDLRGRRTDDNAFWLNSFGKRMGITILERSIRAYAVSNPGIQTHITAHALRRACATHMLQHGAHPVEIQMLLGHAQLSHLRHYLKVSIVDLKAAHAKTRVGE